MIRNLFAVGSLLLASCSGSTVRPVLIPKGRRIVIPTGCT